jgi:hypothetical protein
MPGHSLLSCSVQKEAADADGGIIVPFLNTRFFEPLFSLCLKFSLPGV